MTSHDDITSDDAICDAPAERPVLERVLSNLGVAAGPVVAGVVILLVVRADRMVFEDSPPSPLYQATLDGAYSRFRQSDAIVSMARRSRSADTDLQGSILDPEAALKAQHSKAASGHGHDHDGPPFTDGDRLVEEGRFDDAIAKYREAFKDDPRCSLAHHRIADALNAAGRWEESINAYREVLKVAPDYLCVYEHMADIFGTHDRSDERDRMLGFLEEEHRRRARRSGSDGIGGKIGLASFLVKQSRPEEAVRVAEEVMQIDDSEKHQKFLARCKEYLALAQSEKKGQ